MRIKLVDVDSKIPNLALMKISARYKTLGHTVGFDINDPDRVFVSVIFKENKPRASVWGMKYPGITTFGGPGWDLKSTLPWDTEFHKPDYDLYPSEYSQGFTTRGCIRGCPFCIVREKEGLITEWEHPSEFHDDRFDTCLLLDNNLFAADHDWIMDVLEWFRDSGIKMDMTQGYDARLLTEKYAEILRDIMPANGIRFSWDNTRDEEVIVRTINLLKESGFDLKHEVSFHVLAGYSGPGYDPSFEDALYRCNRLREMGTNAFVMQYHKRDPRLRVLAHNCNQRSEYWKMKPLSKRFPMPRKSQNQQIGVEI
jgi:hypothetical protein